jgi:hypothetical protein
MLVMLSATLHSFGQTFPRLRLRPQVKAQALNEP